MTEQNIFMANVNKNICKCGHEKEEHYYHTCGYHNEQDENGEVEYCPCKKFVPQKKQEEEIRE
jgi:hypothetical protein